MTTRATFAAAKAYAATPSDTVADPGGISRAIYISASTTGAATLLLEDDSTAVAFAGLIVGVVYPFRVKRVNNTSLGVTIIMLA